MFNPIQWEKKHLGRFRIHIQLMTKMLKCSPEVQTSKMHNLKSIFSTAIGGKVS